MQNLTGSYVWHHVNNENRIDGVEENHQYLVCFEVEEETGSVWKMKLAYWYNEGAKITIRESDGTPHKFSADKEGFYIFDDITPRCFRLRDVRYWTAITEPDVKTEDVLTIV